MAPSQLEISLDRAPDRKAKWTKWLAAVPASQKPAAEYLLIYMPLADLRGLEPKFVTAAMKIAFQARAANAWAQEVPEDVFLDAVLPYASVTEPRESMRAEFQARYSSLAAGAYSSGEAALAVNKALFADYHVVYNTKRLRTDQSARESVRQGMATCTGLSIMLVEALRSVGVPARLAGIPSWPGSGGNHTWVEVWDAGSWHFLGAAEPDPLGLDHAWFKDQAAGAVADKPENAIYAVTYRDGGARFPLAWLPGESIPAENVTARYKVGAHLVEGPSISVEVTLNGERVVAEVQVCPVGEEGLCIRGHSMGPNDDVNRRFTVSTLVGKTYKVTVTYQGKTVEKQLVAKNHQVVRIDMK